MTTDHECEGYARECVRLANLTSNPRIRDRLMQMAREWMAVVITKKRHPSRKCRSSRPRKRSRRRSAVVAELLSA
jgi:hypothetical protein